MHLLMQLQSLSLLHITPSADFDNKFTVASSQTIDMNNNQITNVADPTAALKMQQHMLMLLKH